MDDQKKQIVDKLKSATNILVTVSTNPSVDQLAAAIGLTLVLNKMDKHASAVFSGEVPSTLSFLKPEETLEKDTSSLRDFIISLDKSKADKLRYKVEEDVVKIFITPYKTSITDRDLDFSQGDFNVDVVVALGVRMQEDLDGAITAHGRILHDATVITINHTPEGDLGSLKWQDLQASSLSELIASIVPDLGKDLLDPPIATALLTGIVAETNRFSNDNTSPNTMSISAKLMEGGADQQLVATQLEQPGQEQAGKASQGKPVSGTLEVGHDAPDEPAAEASEAKPEPPESAQAHADTEPDVNQNASGGPRPSDAPHFTGGSKMVLEPPTMGSPLMGSGSNYNIVPPEEASAAAPQHQVPLLSHDSPKSPDKSAEPKPDSSSKPKHDKAEQKQITKPASASVPAAPEVQPTPTPAIDKDQTLEDIERSVSSPHVHDSLHDARKAVEQALINSSADEANEPLKALASQNIDLPIHDEPVAPPPAQPTEKPIVTSPGPSAYSQSAPFNPTAFLSPQPAPSNPLEAPEPQIVKPSQSTNEPAPLQMSPADQPFTMPLPNSINVPGLQLTPPTSSTSSPTGPPPPPVPPPMLPPFPHGS